MRRRIALFAAPIAALSLIAAGCGGGGDKTTTGGGGATSSSSGGGDPVAVLSGIKVADQVSPAKIGIKVNVGLKGTISNPQVAAIMGDGPISVDLNGPFDPTKKTGDLTFDLKAGKIALNGALKVIDGTKGFVQLGGKWYEIPADSLKTSTDTADPQKVFQSMGDPAKLFKNPTYVGEEDIEGLKTDHVAGEVDQAGLVAAIGNIAKAQGKTIDQAKMDEATKKLGEVLKSAKADVWVGKDDKQVHKLQIVADAVMPADTKAQSGLDGATVDMTVQSIPTDSPTVEAPSGALPSSQLQSDLTTIILQGLGSGGTSTTP